MSSKVELIAEQMATGLEIQRVWSNLIYNVKDKQFAGGAKGDGVTDDTAAIQMAINTAAAAGGGVVFFPSGNYIITSSLIKKAKVSLEGAAMRESVLLWSTISGGTILNTANQDLAGTFIRNLEFSKTDSVTGDVTGILGGSTTANYNSAGCVFENLMFYNIKYGIAGNAEPTGVGIFDSTFIFVWSASCYYGIWNFGSGNTFVNLRLTTNTAAGIVLDYLNANSYSGVHVFGGVFVQNGSDIIIPNAGGIRPCSFDGTWFEQSTNGIINITNASTKIISLLLSDCMLSTNATNWILNFSNAVGVITVDTCTIDQVSSSSGKDINAPASMVSKLIVRNTWGINYDGSNFVFDTTQRGAVNISAPQSTWASVAVTFPHAFPSGIVPYVVLNQVGGNKVFLTAASITATGFTLFANNQDATSTLTIDYIAIAP